MTRENKLALVVGFGLVLFVGILVSDHLSAVHREQPADLNERFVQRTPRETVVKVWGDPPIAHNATGSTVRDDAMRAGVDPPIDPLAGDGPVRQPPAEVVTVPDSSADEPDWIEEPLAPEDRLVLGDRNRPGSLASRDHVHTVAAGESLTSIARRYYNPGGDLRRVVDRLAAHNGMSNPNALQIGAELRLPPADILGVGGGSITQTVGRQTQVPRFQEYTVRSGDTMSSIAERLLGSRSRVNELIELNRDRVPEPDRLRLGTRIRVPVSASRLTSNA